MSDNKRPESMRRIDCPELAKAFIDEQVAAVRAQVGDKKVLLALSGGVDSSVVAALLIKAIGKQLVCVHVNHGLMRKGESEQVIEVFQQSAGRQPDLRGRGRPLPGQAGRRDRPRKEAQDHRRRVHPRVRGGGPQAGGHRLPGPGHDLSRHPGTMPTPRQERTTTSAACLKTCSFELVEPLQVCCSRTRCARSAQQLGLPDVHGLSPALPRPRPGRALPGRDHPATAWTPCASRTPSSARRFAKARLGADVWQYFTVRAGLRAPSACGRRHARLTSRSSCAPSTPSTSMTANWTAHSLRRARPHHRSASSTRCPAYQPRRLRPHAPSPPPRSSGNDASKRRKPA